MSTNYEKDENKSTLKQIAEAMDYNKRIELLEENNNKSLKDHDSFKKKLSSIDDYIKELREDVDNLSIDSSARDDLDKEIMDCRQRISTVEGKMEIINTISEKIDSKLNVSERRNEDIIKYKYFAYMATAISVISLAVVLVILEKFIWI